MRVNWLQFFRKTHLYNGVFTAPAILFFALTGSLQTFSLHESARDGSYKPAQWILVLAQLHKKQTIQVPVRKTPPQLAPASSSADKRADEKKADPTPQLASPQPRRNLLPLKIFFLVVALSLFFSTLSGLYLAWKYRRGRILATGLLLAGVVVPILLMQLQDRVAQVQFLEEASCGSPPATAPLLTSLPRSAGSAARAAAHHNSR